MGLKLQKKKMLFRTKKLQNTGTPLLIFLSFAISELRKLSGGEGESKIVLWNQNFIIIQANSCSNFSFSPVFNL